MSRSLLIPGAALAALLAGASLASGQAPAAKSEAKKGAPAAKKEIAAKKAASEPGRLTCRVSGNDSHYVTIANGTPTDIAAGTRITWSVGPANKRCRAPRIADWVAASGVLPPGGTITLSAPEARAACATRCEAAFAK